MQETIVYIRLGEIRGVLLRLGRTCHAAGRPVAALNWETVDAAVDPTARRSSIGTPKSSLQSVIFMGRGMSTSTGDILDVYRDLTRLTSIASLVFFNQSWCVVLLPSCRITNQDEGFFLPGHELTVIGRSEIGTAVAIPALVLILAQKWGWIRGPATRNAHLAHRWTCPSSKCADLVHRSTCSL